MSIISKFLDKKNIFALVGASNNPEKFGNKIFNDLIGSGYTVIPINSNEKEIEGIPCSDSIKDVSEKIDVVIFVIPPEKAFPVLQTCKELQVTNIWFQPGASNQKTINFCEQNNLNYIHDQCIMVQRKIV